MTTSDKTTERKKFVLAVAATRVPLENFLNLPEQFAGNYGFMFSLVDLTLVTEQSDVEWIPEYESYLKHEFALGSILKPECRKLKSFQLTGIQCVYDSSTVNRITGKSVRMPWRILAHRELPVENAGISENLLNWRRILKRVITFFVPEYPGNE